jgi:hypothetical protein
MLFALNALIGSPVQATDGRIGSVKDFLFHEGSLDGGRHRDLARGPQGADPSVGDRAAGDSAKAPRSDDEFRRHADGVRSSDEAATHGKRPRIPKSDLRSSTCDPAAMTMTLVGPELATPAATPEARDLFTPRATAPCAGRRTRPEDSA